MVFDTECCDALEPIRYCLASIIAETSRICLKLLFFSLWLVRCLPLVFVTIHTQLVYILLSILHREIYGEIQVLEYISIVYIL